MYNSKIFNLLLLIFFSLIFCGCSRSPYELVEIGKIKVANNDMVGAVENFSMAIELDSNFTNAYYEIAKYNENPNQRDHLKRYLKLELPRIVDAYIGLGMMSRLKNDNENALINFEKAIYLDYNRAQAHGLIFEALYSSGDSSKAFQYKNSLPDKIKHEIDSLMQVMTVVSSK